MTTRTPDPIEYLSHIMFAGGGGVCVYAWHWAGNSWFEATTSLCSRDDVYDEQMAEKLARDNAMEYQCIKLPLRVDSDRFHLDANQLAVLASEALYRIGY